MKRLDDRVRRLLDGKNLAHVATLDADGRPRVHPTWVGRDDDLVLINTQEGRAWLKRVRRDPRIALSVANLDQPSEYVEIVGRVVLDTTEGALEHIDVLARRYTNADYRMHYEGEERVLFGIAAERVNYVNLLERVPGIPEHAQPGRRQA